MGGRPAFGVGCGDIIYDDLAMYPEYERGVRRIGTPFFQVIGNHDLDYDGPVDEAATRTFSRHFGPRYYSFDRGAVHYVILYDVFYHGTGYIGYVQQDQLRWLEEDLAGVESGSTVVVCLHIPVQGTRHIRDGVRDPAITVSVNNREGLYRLLEPFNAQVLSGHTHENDHNYDNGVHEHVSGTVCGAWWSGPICGDGTPHGYSVYDVDGEAVSWRYQSTGFGADHQMRAYLPGADPQAPHQRLGRIRRLDGGLVRGRGAERADGSEGRLRSGKPPDPRWRRVAPPARMGGPVPPPEDMQAWAV